MGQHVSKKLVKFSKIIDIKEWNGYAYSNEFSPKKVMDKFSPLN